VRHAERLHERHRAREAASDVEGVTWTLKLRADASIPEPWIGIDPPSNGIVWSSTRRRRAGSTSRSPAAPAGRRQERALDVSRPDGAVGGIIKVVVQDRRTRAAGLLRVVVKGRPRRTALPDVSAARTTLVVGASDECASVAWGGPSAASPRCRGERGARSPASSPQEILPTARRRARA
jgi:hypothetical protein